jgi:hypothetical protein
VVKEELPSRPPFVRSPSLVRLANFAFNSAPTSIASLGPNHTISS